MASIDMKDAYYSIPVKSEDRKYLRFKWEDQFYELGCRVLPASSQKLWNPL